MITLVLGGARSGKSAVAERLVGRLSLPVTYVATGVASDSDMAARIQLHRERRPASWGLVEVQGDELADALLATEGAVLLDALGTWVASLATFDATAVAALCRALVERDGDTVIVSDEVGLGVHPSTEVGRQFRDDLGRLNTVVADLADEVLLVIAGRVLPLEPLA